MREAVGKAAGDAQGEPRLAAAAGARQRHDPVRSQHLGEPVDLRTPADERRHVARQVRRRVDSPQPPIVVRGAGRDDAVKAGGLLEVLDGAQALVDDRDGQTALEGGFEAWVAAGLPVE